MSWLYSRALAAAYSEATSSDGEPFALSNVTPTPPGYSSHVKTTEASRRSRSGMTYAPLTEQHGADVLTWFLADSLARISPSPERAPASTENAADCGEKWRESLTKYDRATCSWKTHQCLFSEDLPTSSVTLPRWGMLRLGVLWERQTSGRRTIDSGSGSSASMKQEIAPYGSNVYVATNGGATCTTSTHTTASVQASKIGTLTPIAPLVKKWPTPAARDYRHPNKKTYHDRGGNKKGEQLPNAVGGPLNPTWVEWLMGWPLGWTDLEPLETDKFQRWRRLRGEL
jgi:hypothetical protein